MRSPSRSARSLALIGPSGCGKSTFLRCLNRMNDLIEGDAAHRRRSCWTAQDIYGRSVNLVTCAAGSAWCSRSRTRSPSRSSRTSSSARAWPGCATAAGSTRSCERCLRQAALWDEVKDRLHESALNLSGGQQQRLCIARALATDPEVLLMDEPASALDPASTARIEDLIFELKRDYTIVIVTHNMQQAARVSDLTAFFFQGRLIEVGPTDQIFTRPQREADGRLHHGAVRLIAGRPRRSADL